MELKVEKMIKRSNKKKGRNITLSLMIMFLLNCVGAMAEVNSTEGQKDIGTSVDNKENIKSEGKVTDNNQNVGNGLAKYCTGETAITISPIKNTANISAFVDINDGSVVRESVNGGNGIGIYSKGAVTVKNFENTGNIIGKATTTNSQIGSNNSNSIGNGVAVYAYGSSRTIQIFGKNEGNIAGYANNVSGTRINAGNGIGLMASASGGQIVRSTIENTGLISGSINSVSGEYNNVGNGIGIYGHNSVEVGNIYNAGLISGNSTSSTAKYTNVGNGIGIYSFENGSTVGDITNTGIIKGSNAAISVMTISQKNSTGIITNYGILAGQKIVDVSENKDIERNSYGLEIMLNAQGEISSVASGKETMLSSGDNNYTVINGKIVEDGKSTESIKASGLKEQTSKLVLNGVDKTLTVDKEVTLTNSIINGYNTAIEVTSENKFTGIDVIINGGVDGKSAAIVGDDAGNKVVLSGNSKINGNIDLGNGKDTLVFGDITSNVARTLGIRETTSSITINSGIAGVENIDVNQNVVLGEDAKVTGAEAITIGDSGSLALTLKTDGEKATHALTGNQNLTITGSKGENADLILVTNGAAKETVVDMTGITLSGLSIGTDSILDKVVKVDKAEGNITIKENGDLEGILGGTTGGNEGSNVGSDDTTNGDSDNNAGVENPDNGVTPENPGDTGNDNTDTSNPFLELVNRVNYEDLNGIALAAMNADKEALKEIIGSSLTRATDSQKENLVNYLLGMYTASPYSLSSELSRKSADMFKNSVLATDLHPELNKWAVYGGFTHVDGGIKDAYYGMDSEIYTSASYGVEADSKLTGLYVMGEYGVQEDLTAGVIFGGNKAKTEIDGRAKVEGDAIYLGAFAKKYVGNLRLVAGAGYQYGDYKADRYVNAVTGVKSYDANYNDNTFNVYTDAKYSHKIAENTYLEPSLGFNYVYISQDGAKEDGRLAIETASKEFNYSTVTTGLDVRKDIKTQNMKHTVTAGVFYDRLVDGAKEDKIKANFVGGNDEINLLVASKNEHTVGVRAKYEVELQNGVSFDVKGSYTFARDTHNGNAKNEAKGEWIVGAGIGYRF